MHCFLGKIFKASTWNRPQQQQQQQKSESQAQKERKKAEVGRQDESGRSRGQEEPQQFKCVKIWHGASHSGH